MSRVQRKTMTWLAALCLLFSLSLPSALAKPQADTSTRPTTPTTTTKTTKKKTTSAASASASEIAAAKAKGEVWVNLDTGIYHKGGRWYGKTKNGKFMTQQEAKAAGYKESKRD